MDRWLNYFDIGSEAFYTADRDLPDRCRRVIEHVDHYFDP